MFHIEDMEYYDVDILMMTEERSYELSLEE
jgi:hypothetical protein